MSKIVDMYLKLKKENSEKMYLFKSGKFYIFIGEDCEKINDYVVLKKVKFSGEYYKCGFPNTVLDNYLRVFKNQNLDIEVVEDCNNEKKDVSYEEKYKMIEKFINRIDIDKITPLDAISLIYKLRMIINDEK